MRSGIFPREQRALAAGIHASGAVLATLLAPKLVIYLATEFHWRWAIFVAGGLGVTWLVPWLLIFRRPEERAPGWAATPVSDAVRGSGERGTVLRRPAFWAVAAVGNALVPGGYFISQWLPSYFTHEWRLSYDQALGDRLVLIYLAQDAGLWLGGWCVMRLARGGRSVLAARRMTIAGAYAIAMAIMILPFTRSLALTTGLICAYVFALGCWSANMGAFKQEVSARRVGTVAALVGVLETGFAAFVIDRIGKVAKNTGGFGAVFPLLAGFLTFAAAVVYWFFRPRYFPLSVDGPSPPREPAGVPVAAKLHATSVAAPRAPAKDG